MDSYSLIIIISFGIVAFIASILINYLMLKFSINLGVRNNEELNQVRWSNNVKPSLGGFSFYFIFLFSAAIAGFISNGNSTHFHLQMLGLIVSCTIGFVVGLADDTYNTNPLVKFMGQLTCAFVLIACDVYIRVFDIPSLDFMITIFWVIGLMNSINMLDNMDGITTTISAIIIIGMFSLGLLLFNINLCCSLVIVGVLGALFGFLIYNWNPSRMYMGDTGSQFIGVFLAALSIMFIWNFKDSGDVPMFQFKQFVIPMLLFIVPIIDTATVTIRRLMRKQSPFVGGRDHITHHLAYIGMKDSTVALVLILTNVVSIPMSIFLIVSGKWTQQITFGAFAYFTLLFLTFQVLYNKGTDKKALKDAAKIE
jgi:UDP-GlcNAc:undecaprenyl-phosphate/decaprenyl-phosphate GlcNAc-1-phosphate transferase